MASPEALRRVRDILFRELVLRSNTGFWGVGIGRGEVILHFDKSRAKRRINAPNTYAINGEVVRVRIIKARTPRTLTQRSPKLPL